MLELNPYIRKREEALKLHSMGLGYRRISKLLGIPVSTLEGWIRYRKRAGIPKRVKLHPTPSAELAYLLGAYLGDMYACEDKHGHHYLMTRVKDEEFADAIVSVATRLGLKPSKRRKGKYYEVKIHSKPLVRFLKESSLNEVEELIEGYETDFLRGLYDAEGNLHKSRWIGVRIVNTRSDIIDLARKCLEKLGIAYSIYVHRNREGNRKPVLGIQIASKGAISKFFSMVGTNISRKKLDKGW